MSLLGKREPESSGKDRGKLALRPDTVVASTDSAATTTIRHAVSDRQSTHPMQARLEATVNLAATTISDLFPTTGSETGREGRQQEGKRTAGASIYDAPNGPDDATEM